MVRMMGRRAGQRARGKGQTTYNFLSTLRPFAFPSARQDRTRFTGDEAGVKQVATPYDRTTYGGCAWSWATPVSQ